MGIFSKKNTSSVDWIHLTSQDELEELIEQSNEKPVLLFKHSTRCSISAMAKRRIEDNWDLNEDELLPVYLDLIKFREVSNTIADKLNVKHESPQVILLKDEKVQYYTSHSQISVEEIKQAL